MGTFYVDSVNGSNANDGLSPATAFADFYFITVEGESENTVSDFWVRGGSEFTLVENAILMSFRNIISWPIEGDLNYDSRPQEGIDSGWDSYVDRSTFNLDTFRPSSSSTKNYLTFSRFIFTSSSASDKKNFSIKQGFYGFDDCDFYINGYSSNYFSSAIFQMYHSDPVKFIFNRCGFYSSRKNSLFVSETDYHIIGCEFIFNDCFGKFDVLMFSSDSNTAGRWRDTLYEFNRCDFEATNTLIGVACKRIDDADGITVKVNDSTIYGKSIVKDIYHYSSYAYAGRLSVFIKGSELYLFEDVVNLRHDNISALRGASLDIKSSKVSCRKLVQITSSASYKGGYCNYIDVSNSEIEMESILKVDQCVSQGKITYRGNKTLSCTGNVVEIDRWYTDSYSRHELVPRSYIEFIDSVIGGDVLIGAQNIELNIRNSIVNGTVSDQNTTEETVKLSSVDVRSILGRGIYYIERSKIEPSTSISAIDNVMMAEIKDSEIISPYGQICQHGGSATVTNSIITADTNNDIEGKFTVFSSKLNGTNISYLEKDVSTKKSISPVFREGGSPGTILVYSSIGNDMSTSISEIRGIVDESTAIECYFSSTVKLDLLIDIVSSEVIFDMLDGSKKQIPCVVKVDTSSLWDGVSIEYEKYVCVSEYVPSDVDFSKEIRFNTNINIQSGRPKELFFDLTVVGK